MPPKKPAKAPARQPEHDNPVAVDALIAAIDHPLVPLIQRIGSAILTSGKGITEGVKWNSPSFYCHGWFATVNLRDRAGKGRGGVLVVLHHGAKARPDASLRDTIKDAAGLLHWHAADRASVGFADAEEFESKRAAFVKLIGQWAREQRRLAGESGS